MSLVKHKYSKQIQAQSVGLGDEDLAGKSAEYIAAYNAGEQRARHEAAMIACCADADIASLAVELVNAHNQLLMAADCLERGRRDEALLHCWSMVRPRRNVLGSVGVDV